MRRLVCVLPFFVLACHSAGPYGYSRSYVPLGSEQDAAEHARDYDPVMAQRERDEWKKSPVSVFGVVKSRSPASDGSAYVALSVRTLESRNLCDDFDEDTCRVTVSEHEYAIVHARLKLSAEDEIGPRSVGPASLVRVIGKVTDDVDPDDGTPVVRASYYRHWPHHYFVTSADRDHMRR